MMDLDAHTFEHLHPGRRIVFEFPFTNPRGSQEEDIEDENCYSVSIAVLDASNRDDGEDEDCEVECAAMLVPQGKEQDWMYESEGGQWQLLNSANVLRLMIVRRNWQRKQGLGLGLGLGLGSGLGVYSSSQHGSSEDERRRIRKGNLNGDDGKEEENEEEEGDARFLKRCKSNGNATSSVFEDGRRSLHPQDDEDVKRRLNPLLVALVPRVCFRNGIPAVPFVVYTDKVIHRVVVEEAYSALTGFMVIEDVALEEDCPGRELASSREARGCQHGRIHFRRRLRFKRMPNLIQTEVPLIFPRMPATDPSHKFSSQSDDDAHTRSVEGMNPNYLEKFVDCEEFRVSVQVDHTRLVHKYLPPIAAGLVLAAPCIEVRMESREDVKILALGVGGGALPMFLHNHFGFHIQAVDVDKVVLDLAHRHFGLQNSSHMKVEVGDALQFMSRLAVEVANSLLRCKSNETSGGASDPRVHVIVVDVDEGDARLELSSPPSKFLEQKFLTEARTVLHPGGLLAMNVVPTGAKVYQEVVTTLSSIFEEVYETVVERDVNHVVFALPAKGTGLHLDGTLASALRNVLDVQLFTGIHRASIDGLNILL